MKKSILEMSQHKANAMDFLKNAIMIIDANYKILYLNPACEKLLKVKKEEVLQQNAYDLHPDAPEDVRHIENTVKYGRPTIVKRMPYQFGDFNSYFNLETHLLEENGEIIGALAEFSDVTEFVLEEEKFKYNLEQMASNIILLPEGKGILPLNQTIIDDLEIDIIIQKVLMSVSQKKLSSLIVDLSSVLEANAHFLHSINGLLSALKLLGVSVTITGVKPEVAQKMAVTGVSLDKHKVQFISSLRNAF
ncbi:PAS domain-containing protein [Rossellomorea vietnamensis]|uniref:PAS domain-containing protein n=1 Tax=Rossellomorea vietnamensis TaxID=218284 RepID=A0A5D4M5J3_9BACI|nr:PAS domain-containing protein [Rossellomorea vietnamensis]TYR96781.1 PAS domain-containing protein [Rossellomorea vietnamensis]